MTLKEAHETGRPYRRKCWDDDDWAYPAEMAVMSEPRIKKNKVFDAPFLCKENGDVVVSWDDILANDYVVQGISEKELRNNTHEFCMCDLS